jgi:hypothetical protein
MVREREYRFLSGISTADPSVLVSFRQQSEGNNDRPWISQHDVYVAARTGLKSSSDRAPASARRAERSERSLQFCRTLARATENDAGLGGLSGRAESWGGSYSAV